MDLGELKRALNELNLPDDTPIVHSVGSYYTDLKLANIWTSVETMAPTIVEISTPGYYNNDVHWLLDKNAPGARKVIIL